MLIATKQTRVAGEVSILVETSQIEGVFHRIHSMPKAGASLVQFVMERCSCPVTMRLHFVGATLGIGYSNIVRTAPHSTLALGEQPTTLLAKNQDLANTPNPGENL